MTDHERFINYLRFEKRSSEHTVIAYENDLKQYADYLGIQYQLIDLTQSSHFIIRSWIVSLMEAGLDPRSVNRKITTLRTFYRFLVKTGRLERTPMIKVMAPKTKKKLPEYVDEPRMQKLFVLEAEQEAGFENLRNLLIMDFFYRTGVRLSELIGLKVSDVNLYNLTITVLGKRNKIRQIPITNNFRQILTEYLAERQKFMLEHCTDHPYFFVENKGNQMYPGFVYRLVKNSISRVSTGEKRSPHVLRHSFATAMLNHGADINAIKELLGHSSLAATQVYTHNSIEKLKEIYKQAFPKA
ncbi:MAG: tyrosine-type recombinase/integrase [Bacteroidetes bacterium]|nr:tyrosine-type recombinase/integrase [Bacteroidota bacterium]